MAGEIGRWALFFLLLFAPYTIAANLLGVWLKSPRLVSSGRAGMLACAFLSIVASAALIVLLLTDNFAYQYVVNYSSSDMPLVYKVSAFWGGNAGSLLLWALLLSIYGALASYLKHRHSTLMQPYVSAVLAFLLLFFVLILNFVASPFALSMRTVTEGNSLNPLLQNPSMTVHPVNLYLGYIGFAVPFAYGVAALITNRRDATWLKVTRRWTLVSWLFLGVGILYGSQWAYEELGWGGFWAWDPVENAALMPWLTATAFLHSSMIQEKKGMLKGWNMCLIMLTFLLTIFGTFLTRSGLLWSVHAFSNGPIGVYFLIFIGILVMGCLLLLIWKWPLLRAESQFESVVSKESSFLLNNLFLLGAAFAIGWGTLYPVVSEWITQEKMTVGAPFFNTVNVPLFLLVIFLMGLGPLIAWKRSSIRLIWQNAVGPLMLSLPFLLLAYVWGARGLYPLLATAISTFAAMAILSEFGKAALARRRMTGEALPLSLLRLFQRNRRRYGGYIVHFAVVLLALGFTGASAFDRDIQQVLQPGETLRIGPYQLIYEGLDETTSPQRTEIFATLILYRDGQETAVLRPEKVFYTNGLQPSTEVAIWHTAMDDLFVVLGGWEQETDAAVFQVRLFPLINWVWAGTYVLIAGTLIALWPEGPRVVRRSSLAALPKSADKEAEV